MKRILLIILALLMLSTPVLAESGFSDSQPLCYEKLLSKSGYEYMGYGIEYSFSAVYEEKPDEIGCILQRCPHSDGQKYYPVYLRCVYFSETGNYTLKFSGWNLRAGEYTITPYFRYGTEYIKGGDRAFEIAESWDIITHLRIVQDKLDQPDFTAEELELIDIIRTPLAETIQAWESDHSLEITENYIYTNYPAEYAQIKALSQTVDVEAMALKFDYTGIIALNRIRKLFGI